MQKYTKKFSCFYLIVIGLLIISFSQILSLSIANAENLYPNLMVVNWEEQFTLKLNQVAYLKSENLTIKFVKVQEDSRCPIELQCLWAGQAKILLHLEKGYQDIQEIMLISSPANQDLATQKINNSLIQLIAVNPYPQKNQNIQLSAYTINLIVRLKSR